MKGLKGQDRSSETLKFPNKLIGKDWEPKAGDTQYTFSESPMYLGITSTSIC